MSRESDMELFRREISTISGGNRTLSAGEQAEVLLIYAAELLQVSPPPQIPIAIGPFITTKPDLSEGIRHAMEVLEGIHRHRPTDLDPQMIRPTSESP